MIQQIVISKPVVFLDDKTNFYEMIKSKPSDNSPSLFKELNGKTVIIDSTEFSYPSSVNKGIGQTIIDHLINNHRRFNIDIIYLSKHQDKRIESYVEHQND
jgi:hypothetical protein